MTKLTNYKETVIVAAVAILAGVFAQPAQCDSLRLPAELGRMEGARDMNLFAIEPSILNERFYTSGKAERHQYIGNVLPAGAPVPDNDAPLCEKHNKSSAEKSEKTEKVEKTESTEKVNKVENTTTTRSESTEAGGTAK